LGEEKELKRKRGILLDHGGGRLTLQGEKKNGKAREKKKKPTGRDAV